MIGLLFKQLLAAVSPYTSFWNSEYFLELLKRQLFNSFCVTKTKTLPYKCECDKIEFELYKTHYDAMIYFYFTFYISIIIVVFTGFFIQVNYIRSNPSNKVTSNTPLINQVLKDLDDINKKRQETFDINQSKKRKFLETIEESLRENDEPQDTRTHATAAQETEFVTIDL